MKILITGIGVTGKSSLRRLLVEKFRRTGITVTQYDADEFAELRCAGDVDCTRPDVFRDDVLYIVEDVRGTLSGRSFLPLGEYDGVVYVLPGFVSHTLFWLPRLWRWFQTGKFSWDRNTGWKEVQKPYDIRNCSVIVRVFLRDMRYRSRWIRKDLDTIAGSAVPCTVLHPRWSPRGIRWDF